MGFFGNEKNFDSLDVQKFDVLPDSQREREREGKRVRKRRKERKRNEGERETLSLGQVVVTSCFLSFLPLDLFLTRVILFL